MDDECVEELGRPISSLKVIELRDELTRRALIKTGNKKELVDRLRAAIQRQVSQANAIDNNANEEAKSQRTQEQVDESAIEPDCKIDSSQTTTNVDVELNSSAELNPTKSPESQINESGKSQTSELEVVDTPDKNQSNADDIREQEQEQKQDHLAVEVEPTNTSNINQSNADDIQEQEQDQPKVEVEPTPDEKQSNVDDAKGQEQDQPRVELESTNTINVKQSNADDIKGQEQDQTEVEVEPTNTLIILNLVRPFTVTQLKGVLTQYGAIKEDMFWTDKVKSKCCVVFESVEVAQQTRQFLHGQQWPSSNPKTLAVTYVSEETFHECKNSELVKEVTATKKQDNGAETKDAQVVPNKSSDPLKSDINNENEEAKSQKTQEKVDDSAIEPDSKIDSSQTTTNVDVEFNSSAEVNPTKLPESQTTESGKSKSDSEVVDISGKKQSNADDIKGQEQDQTEVEVEPTNTLIILNLVRPFTVTQLKGVLSTYGQIKEDKFWTDKVKSKCCVVYESVEVAQQTRQFLHGQQWPSSNPKTLSISYVTEETFLQCQNSEVVKEITPAKKPENGGDKKKDPPSKSIISRLGDRLDGVSDGKSTETVKNRLGDRASDDLAANTTKDDGSGSPRKLDDLFRKTKTVPHLFWKPGPGSEKPQAASKSLNQRLGESLDGDGTVSMEVESIKQPVKRRLGDRESGDVAPKQIKPDRAREAQKSRNLDDLFKKTNSVPHIFWLPLTDAEADARRKARQERTERLHREFDDRHK